MKTTCLILLSLAFSVGAQELQVVERGPHHQVLKRITSWVGPNGTTYYRTNRFTELANGLCYRPEGPNAQWELTREEFQAFENGFVANQAPMRVILSANVNAPNAIDAITSDGQHFEISPFFLAMRDGTGQSVLVAQIQDSGGRLIAPNTVLYDQAFPGAAIRVTLTRDGVEQDCVIFDDTDFHPEDYNLNPNTTTIELWSEFITAPESTVTPVFEGEVATDVVVDFGSSRIAAGKAFAADNQDVSIPVRKAYGVIQNRRFLVEKVDYQKVKPFLDNLNPNGAKVGNSDRAARVAQRKVVKDEKELLAQVTAKPRTRRSASLGKPSSTQLMAFDWKRNPGVVIDFQLFNTTSLTSMTFQGDTTYHIAGTVTLSGTTVFEAGAVLKYSNAARVKVTGPVDWRGSTWRPVVFTAIDDVSVGDTVRTNTLTGQYASVALDFDANTAAADFVLQNLRISHATNAIRILGRSGHSITHAQFVNCANAITLTNATSAVRNGLFYNFGTGFTGSNSTARCEQLTLNAGTALNGNSANLTLNLTNTLVTAVTTTTGYSGASVTVLSSASGVYQTVGAGAHYLAPGSPYRTSGASTINSQLAAQLRKLTTYPPVVLSPSSLMGGTVNYTRTVPRATSGNAIGYHYDPIDYAASGLYALNGTTVTIQPGVVFAGYQASPSVNYIMGFDYGAKLQATGTPDLPCEFIWYNSVQEQANTAWQGEVSVLVWRGTFYASAPSAELSFRFTDWILLGTDAFAHISGAEDTSALPTVVRDSSFHGGMLWLVGSKFNLTNCLMDRVATTVWLDASDANRKANVRNSMFFGGALGTYDTGTSLFSVRDTVFYQTITTQGDDSWDRGWNGWYTNGCSNCSNQINTVGLDVTNSITFLSGPLGSFYQPTSGPLINAGSTNNAALFGLYHYTTTTNQVKEANSTNDIGLHYVATLGLTSTAPLDPDGDGVADIFEDLNGSGTLDSGETDVSVYNSKFGIGSPAPGLVVFTLMK